MYNVVSNTQLATLDNRHNLCPARICFNSAYTICYLGRFHTTNYFSIQADGNSTISYNNKDNNDIFSVDIKMVKLNYSVNFTKDSKAKVWYEGTVVNSHAPAFVVAIGDIFKHYYKNNTATVTAISRKKKNGRKSKIVDDGEGQTDEDEEDDSYINDLVLKSLKINITNCDVRAILGSLENWDNHDMRLWDSLLDLGFLKTVGHDFVSFCNTFIILPDYFYEPSNPLISQNLSKLSSYVLVKKLARFFLYGEDPSARGWVQPTRDYFEQPKSIVTIMEDYRMDLSERYSNYESVRAELVRELNNKNKNELIEKYLPVNFPSMQAVERIYPLHAIRNIYLSSWCATDYEKLTEMVNTASKMSKSSKIKHLVAKRGKSQNYTTYEVEGFRYEYHPWSYVEKRENKFDVVKKELNVDRS